MEMKGVIYESIIMAFMFGIMLLSGRTNIQKTIKLPNGESATISNSNS